MPKHPVQLRAGKWLTPALVLCLAPLCFGEMMVVKVLNGSDGAPVSDQFVTVEFRSGKTATVDVRKTDSSGEARFPMPEVKPETLGVEVHFTARGLHCSCRVQTQTETVVREGLIVSPRIRHPKTPSAIQAGPGNIVFVARPTSFLEKVLYEY